MTDAQRQHRSNIRNSFLLASIAEMRLEQTFQNTFGKEVLEEMIQECLENKVDNYGKTPAF